MIRKEIRGKDWYRIVFMASKSAVREPLTLFAEHQLIKYMTIKGKTNVWWSWTLVYQTTLNVKLISDLKTQLVYTSLKIFVTKFSAYFI